MSAQTVIASYLRVAAEDLQGARLLSQASNRNAPDDSPIKPLLREIESLGDFATTFRYPTVVGRVKPAPKAEEFTRFADNVEKALNETCSRFDVDLAA